MLRAGFAVSMVVAVASACGGSDAPAEPTRAAYSVRPLFRVPAPTHVAAAPGDRTRVFIVEQAGRIRVVLRGRLLARPFLDIRRLVVSGGEQGLLSVAFHPRYVQNRRFYVNYTDVNGDTRVVEYRANRARTAALPGTARRLLFVNQPYPNHNGGQLAFGPDGRLYVGLGDGGAGGDPENRAQNLGTLLGKLVTLNVNVARPRPNIAALGLRNPWRFSFDRANGDLYIADVGQNAWEEINYVPRSSSGLENYGWDVYEGRARFESKQPNSAGRLVAPVHVYENNGSECSVTGGFVYRGSAIPALRGRYIFGDYCSGIVWTLRIADRRTTDVRREAFRVPQLSSFGEDASGELYAASLSGRVYKVVP
jgi:glucose/arabinose dehydrogenase